MVSRHLILTLSSDTEDNIGCAFYVASDASVLASQWPSERWYCQRGISRRKHKCAVQDGRVLKGKEVVSGSIICILLLRMFFFHRQAYYVQIDMITIINLSTISIPGSYPSHSPILTTHAFSHSSSCLTAYVHIISTLHFYAFVLTYTTIPISALTSHPPAYPSWIYLQYPYDPTIFLVCPSLSLTLSHTHTCKLFLTLLSLSWTCEKNQRTGKKQLIFLRQI